MPLGSSAGFGSQSSGVLRIPGLGLQYLCGFKPLGKSAYGQTKKLECWVGALGVEVLVETCWYSEVLRV